MRMYANILKLFLLLSCSACSTERDIKVMQAPEVIVVEPPAAFLEPIRDPYKAVATTGGIVDQLVATRGTLQVCTAQVDGMRRWRDITVRKPNEPQH
jgi:hypothetical protein